MSNRLYTAAVMNGESTEVLEIPLNGNPLIQVVDEGSRFVITDRLHNKTVNVIKDGTIQEVLSDIHPVTGQKYRLFVWYGKESQFEL